MVEPSSLDILMVSVSFFSYLHSYLTLAVIDNPGAISGCFVYSTLKFGLVGSIIRMRIALEVKFLIYTVI